MSGNGARRVQRFKLFNVVCGEFQIDGGDRVIQMRELGSADNRGDHTGFGEQPGERRLRRLDAQPRRRFGIALDEGAIELRVIQDLRELIGVRTRGRLQRPAITCQVSAGKRTPRDQPHLLIGAQRNHFPLLFAVQQVVVVLHRSCISSR